MAFKKKKHVIPETCSEFGHFPEANPIFLPTDFSWELPIWISQSCDTKTKGDWTCVAQSNGNSGLRRLPGLVNIQKKTMERSTMLLMG